MTSSTWHGRGCTERLLGAIEDCESEWKGDRAYRDVLHKLDQVEQELDVLQASPGHREAMRVRGPVMSGQIPEDREERMEVEHG